MHGPNDPHGNGPVGQAGIDMGGVRLDPSTRVLVGPDGAVALEPRVMQVLMELVQSRGRVVTRGDLFARCWNDVPVGDDSINRAIFELRQALRRVGGRPKIETIPRTGYRLTGTQIDEPVIESGPSPAQAFGIDRRSLLGGTLALSGAAILWRGGVRSRKFSEAEALVARGDLARRDDLPNASEQGIGFYREALKLVPDDANIWGKLALAQVAVAEYAGSFTQARAVADASGAIRGALALDPQQPEALVADAILAPHFGDWWRIEQKLRHILSFAPDNAAARENLSLVLMEVGRVAEAAAILDRLAEAEPLAPAYAYRHVYQLWARGRLAEADRVADQSLQLWPHHLAVWLARFWTFAVTSRAPAALAMLDDENRADMPPPLVSLLRVSAEALGRGAPTDVAAAAHANVAAARRSPFGVINATLTLPPLGQIEAAYQINRGYLLRTGEMVGALRRPPDQAAVNQQNRRKTMALWMPSAAPLRADPRFAELCRAAGLAAYWHRARCRPDFMTNRSAGTTV